MRHLFVCERPGGGVGARAAAAGAAAVGTRALTAPRGACPLYTAAAQPAAVTSRPGHATPRHTPFESPLQPQHFPILLLGAALGPAVLAEKPNGKIHCSLFFCSPFTMQDQVRSARSSSSSLAVGPMKIHCRCCSSSSVRGAAEARPAGPQQGWTARGWVFPQKKWNSKPARKGTRGYVNVRPTPHAAHYTPRRAAC